MYQLNKPKIDDNSKQIRFTYTRTVAQRVTVTLNGMNAKCRKKNPLCLPLKIGSRLKQMSTNKCDYSQQNRGER